MKPRHAQYPDRCRHFTGIQHACCNEWISYNSVRDGSQAGPYRWPCLTVIGRPAATTTCANRSLLTPEEHDAEEDELTAFAAKALGDVAAGKCHVCGKPAEPSTIVGRCKYAACGHRIGQVSGDEP